MINRTSGDIFEESQNGLKVIAFPMSSRWEDGGYLTAKIEDLCPDAKKWHRSQFRWIKMLNKLGDVHWSMANYTMAFCLLISRKTKKPVDFEKLELCFELLAEGTHALAAHHGGVATIHMPMLKRDRQDYEWLIQDYLDDFEVFLYE
jgi:hypothetical protein